MTPTPIATGVLLSGEMHAQEDFEPIPDNLRVEREGAVVQDTFIGEQTLVAHVRDRGLVVVEGGVTTRIVERTTTNAMATPRARSNSTAIASGVLKSSSIAARKAPAAGSLQSGAAAVTGACFSAV